MGYIYKYIYITHDDDDDAMCGETKLLFVHIKIKEVKDLVIK